jgi:murein DD-endopeptidase MepM/ murein hydrolase activator NlpD
MSLRRWRPVAALTLALLAAPFLAATAVAAQSSTAKTPAAAERRVVVKKHSWLQIIRIAAAETIAPPVQQAPPPPVRASEPPPPPPASNLDDKTTWIFPADGPITSPFGRRWGRLHAGVDIDAAYGSNVIAGQRGTVIAAGWGQTGYGQVVQIQHDNGLVTLYAHLSRVDATVGQVVAQGDLLGAVGKTGSVTAAHLHYEVHVNSAPTNPTPWLTGPHSMQGHPG